MFETVPAEFSIGGRIRAELVPILRNSLVDKGESLEWRDAYFRPEKDEEFSAARQDHDGAQPLWDCDLQASYELFDLMEEFLEREQFSSDDGGGPLSPFTTMMLMAQAVD
jgi:hypothetical protein